MKYIPIRSLRFRLAVFIVFIFMLLIGIVAVNNVIAAREIQNKIYDTMNETLTIYQNRLTDSFNTTENYLKNFAYDDVDIRIIDKGDDSTNEWFSSVYHIQKSFQSALSIYDMDGFFLFSLTGHIYAEEIKSDISYDKSKNIQNTISKQMKHNTFLTKKNKNKWFLIKIDGTNLLFRVFKIHNSYVGAWISTKNALRPFVGKTLTQSVFLVNGNGTVASDQPPLAKIPVSSITDHSKFQYVTVNKEDNLIVSRQMDFGNLSIVSLIPQSQFYMSVNKYKPFIIIIFLIVICLMMLVVYMINRWVIHPLTYLNTAISSLKNGDLDVQIKVDGVCVEFEDVNSAFNEMVSEIKTLKIDVYEEKLAKQQTHTQYLKLQITPHFLINCLNMAYQLAEINRPDLLKVMLKDLSQYLRYTLSSDQTVSLNQEIQHVENYIDLSKIRYPNSILCETDILPETMNATAIPLLIQSFIENTIKYEVVLGKTITIHIDTSIENKEQGKFIHITIWDTGGGFSDKILNHLQDIDQYVKDTSSKHIGISNVLQRASLVFGTGSCKFHFINRPGAGAQIDIEFPYIPFPIKEEIF